MCRWQQEPTAFCARFPPKARETLGRSHRVRGPFAMIGQLEPLFVRGLIHLLALVILYLEHSRQARSASGYQLVFYNHSVYFVHAHAWTRLSICLPSAGHAALTNATSTAKIHPHDLITSARTQYEAQKMNSEQVRSTHKELKQQVVVWILVLEADGALLL